ncbi:MAG: hypothetical protein KDI62_21985 [Anaerolineae bacterium]|nr:hypothetical protein [Anaerolineae bacterium]MCB9102399.1 hypothetical protein [Anaerolineales bacterium]MCB9107686.1 hypothetical protein [Anaerolineales bacterium]
MQNNHHSFIVRIWFEATEAAEIARTWRGSIEQVGQQNRLYFQDLAAMCDFIQDEAGLFIDHSSTDTVNLDIEQS